MATGYEVISQAVTSASPVQIDAPSGKFVVNSFVFQEGGSFGNFTNSRVLIDGSDRVTGVIFPASDGDDYEAYIICVDA